MTLKGGEIYWRTPKMKERHPRKINILGKKQNNGQDKLNNVEGNHYRVTGGGETVMERKYLGEQYI